MNLPMKQRCDELISLHGSVRKALESRRECVARRCREGKQSPAAVEDIKALLEMEEPVLRYETTLSGCVMASCPMASIDIRQLSGGEFIVLINGQGMNCCPTYGTLHDAKIAAENYLLGEAKRTYDMLMK